jgi:hypothetical protein
MGIIMNNEQAIMSFFCKILIDLPPEVVPYDTLSAVYDYSLASEFGLIKQWGDLFKKVKSYWNTQQNGTVKYCARDSSYSESNETFAFIIDIISSECYNVEQLSDDNILFLKFKLYEHRIYYDEVLEGIEGYTYTYHEPFYSVLFNQILNNPSVGSRTLKKFNHDFGSGLIEIMKLFKDHASVSLNQKLLRTPGKSLFTFLDSLSREELDSLRSIFSKEIIDKANEAYSTIKSTFSIDPNAYSEITSPGGFVQRTDDDEVCLLKLPIEKYGDIKTVAEANELLAKSPITLLHDESTFHSFGDWEYVV